MISVCFIAKNEELWIEDCISQLRGFASEVILVDTGSTDRTVELAKGKGARIFHFEWTGNFSDARNFALSKATQPWIFKVDPDERIDRSHLEKLKEYTKSEALGIRCATRAYTNSARAMSEDSFKPCSGEYPPRERGYRGYVETMYLRLFRNLPGAVFTGIVHEDVEPALRQMDPNGIVWAPEVIFHHYGFDLREIERKKKVETYQEMMEREVVANDQNGHVWYELGHSYYQKGDYHKAAETFRRAYEMDPKQPATLVNLGHVLTLVGKREEGEKFLRMALESDSSNANTWVNLAVSRLDAMDFAVAQTCFQRALTLNPDSLMAWRGYGQALAQRGDFAGAESALHQAIERHPHFTDAKIDLALVLNASGDVAKSVSLLKEALLDDPMNERASQFLDQLRSH